MTDRPSKSRYPCGFADADLDLDSGKKNHLKKAAFVVY
jgi:hypothetical protein